MTIAGFMAQSCDPSEPLVQNSPRADRDVRALAEFYSLIGPRVSYEDLDTMGISIRRMMELEDAGLCQAGSAGDNAAFELSPLVIRAANSGSVQTGSREAIAPPAQGLDSSLSVVWVICVFSLIAALAIIAVLSQ